MNGRNERGFQILSGSIHLSGWLNGWRPVAPAVNQVSYAEGFAKISEVCLAGEAYFEEIMPPFFLLF
jgi:hypothetical protein